MRVFKFIILFVIAEALFICVSCEDDSDSNDILTIPDNCAVSYKNSDTSVLQLCHRIGVNNGCRY
ncbi:MAG: hypothetical protein JXK07_02075 [Spirochaetes bacterium]|nr:hypothetical protein [Spirochaetota bacterium]MBN2771840.1 hypothetical protein [Spirochaetota bacterium]